MKIVKVIYEDGSEKSLDNIVPLEISDDKKQQWRNRINYNRQFTKFEEDILYSLDDNTVEDYACENFYLIKEDDKEEKDILDFSDDEIIEEAKNRMLLGTNNSIISGQFINRFLKIIEKENQILLDNLLHELEKKLNI